jgi:hypothetical protein
VSGERREVDLNALVEEALNLAYHGARAQDPSFNVTLERDLDPAVAPIELAPQEMTRVFLNLFGSPAAFKSEPKRKRARRGGPTMSVSPVRTSSPAAQPPRGNQAFRHFHMSSISVPLRADRLASDMVGRPRP